ncbi:TonB-linked SusC/RagA family outer membrane protein [Dyadobacter sp. BE34]|uniref:TonB-linked SusC/RagA family outer membrane protein n=1 Tax=Dyadobacter fermentans TaxID=94254 RepID=A0ABU1QYS8_9BACT|nr:MULTISPECIES: TonB-dependent receptor [Dyadobacter]MDR6806281.1 TonB-linked SusC/RagA family outer membrane protein [Dyadobacter fermentans]MDR7044022.1 TonB-linked SusC/RagA family outer membrane protein [Dyadobacter sp. BE242]MDR7198333.1 TonB-linked SusC/RagA family outer membrane protein [Dyadobacter sp. BE34]MDR7216295.1 TonB-linked SusC/RagA family outer membrane protein [Dyadobacter sp. BE31]MDR7264179.1 TonB-linked SusC/RagA family outer membrane protein [Dyadobacter sp. BE32]
MMISEREKYRSLTRYFYSLLLTLLVMTGAYAQDVTVKGKVNDEQGQGLPGVSVLVKGTSTGTVTDIEGNYTVNAPGTATLVFSFIGYITQEIPLGNKTSLDVKMATDTKALDEVVVVGYGTAKKATLTGSVTAVKGAELQKAPSTNLSNTLGGRLPGVSAVQASGEPGYDGSAIRIRGTNSLGNSNALIVVDGVPNRSGGLDRLNPADIESISVLKDAAAAIYGSRAGNGVILITTKRGKSGKPQLSYDLNLGIAQPTRTPQMSNAAEYATIRNELQIYDNLPVGQWQGALQGFNTNGAYTRTDNGNVLNAVFTPTDIQKFRDGSDPLTHPNTDWYGAVIRNWSPQQRHNLQLTGGSENIKYLASLGYINQDGNYVNSATGYKQYDMRVNLDTKINKYVTAKLGVVMREEFRRFPNGGGAGDIFRMLMRGKPTEIAIWPDGRPGPDIENGQNPAVITTNTTGYNNDKRDYIQTNGQLDIDVPGVPGLKVTAMAAIDKQMRRQKSFQKPWTLYYWDKKTYEADGTTPLLTGTVRSTFNDPRLTETSSQELSIQLTGQASYEKTFGSHSFNAMVGAQRETVDADGFFAYRRYFISPVVDQLFAGGTPEQNIGNSGTNNGDLYKRARLSYFGRVGYNFKEKYLAEFLWRADGSYVFPKQGRFGFFPGVSAGWRISEEGFWKNNIHFVNNVKLRASWGQMGAEPYLLGTENLAEYQYLNTMGFGTYIVNDQVVKTLLESRVANNNFTWEVANNSNFGIEGTLWKDRIAFEIDYFVNNRSKILIPMTGSTPSSAGIDGKLPPVNLGKLQNKGFEFKISYDGSVDNFTYSVGVNGGYAKNTIKYWNETPGIPSYQTTTGRPYQAFLAYQYDGVFRDQAEIDANTINYSGITGTLRPGDMKFKDVNNDGKITKDDMVRSEKTNRPQFTGGVNINLGYKAFDLTILFQGAAGGLQYVGQTESGDIGNYLKYAYDHRWTIDNPSSTDPRLANRNNTYYTNLTNADSPGANTYYLKSNNYLRLKNIELGYNLPSEIGSKIGVGNLRVYVNGLNLFTIDKIKIWDPEATSTNGQYYPQSRVLNAGVRVTF